MNYRILSLDGGGTWALIQAKALGVLYGENTKGRAILQQFDLAAANSGGSIVLGELLVDRTPAEILGFFLDEHQRKAVFSKTSSFIDPILHKLVGVGPKYSADKKLPALRKALGPTGDVPLSQVAAGLRRAGASADLHLLITSFDYDSNRANFFRSSVTDRPQWGHGEVSDVSLAEAIHGASNAPVNYFDKPATFPDHPGRFWDGGIAGCNNPVLAAVTEAVGRGQQPANMVALSIGTGSVVRPPAQPGQPPSPFVQPVEDPGLKNDLRKLATAIVDDPPDIATFLAHVMTGLGVGVAPQADSRIVRMNPLISPVKKNAGAWAAPDAMTPDDFTFLVNLELDAVEQKQANAISRYADLWLQDVAPNQPIRMNGRKVAKELGQDKFSAAKAAWETIK